MNNDWLDMADVMDTMDILEEPDTTEKDPSPDFEVQTTSQLSVNEHITSRLPS